MMKQRNKANRQANTTNKSNTLNTILIMADNKVNMLADFALLFLLSFFSFPPERSPDGTGEAASA